ncbi:MAG TPA: hypothetical protein GXZ59_06270 [Clostridiaceae bacterium]|nr:hypothetical protein [Clostridiaceae bacterium]
MKTVNISDVTLREISHLADAGLGFNKIIKIARLFDQLGVDIIDCPPIENLQEDSLLLKSLAAVLKQSRLAVPVGVTAEQLEQTCAALEKTPDARLQVMLPVSTVMMEYELHLKPSQLLELTRTLIEAARNHTNDVEFIAEDATRAREDFLQEVVNTALDAGATSVTFCDRQDGYLPYEFSAFIERQLANIPRLQEVPVGVQCGSNVSLAEANSLAALDAGISVLKTSVIGASGICNTINLARLERLRSDLPIKTRLEATLAEHLADQILVLATPDSERSPAAVSGKGLPEATAEESEHVFTSEDGADTINAAIQQLGYTLNAEDQLRVYEAFQEIAAGKSVSLHELDVIVAETSMQVSPTYTLEHYAVTETSAGAFCQIRLGLEGGILEGLGSGNGPIDAAFSAIERIVGHRFELDDFQIRAITQGHEALGEAFIRLRYKGLLFSGTGLSTDIIGSSIRAYVNALNKIANEESIQSR